MKLKTSISDNADFVEQMTYAIDVVAKRAVDEMESLLDAFIGTNGVPFGKEKATPEQQMIVFDRINIAPDGWVTWMEDVRQRLEEGISAIPPAEREKYSLGDQQIREIAVLAAVEYRDRMEQLRAKVTGAERLPTDALLPPQEEDVIEVDVDGNPI